MVLKNPAPLSLKSRRTKELSKQSWCSRGRLIIQTLWWSTEFYWVSNAAVIFIQYLSGEGEVPAMQKSALQIHYFEDMEVHFSSLKTVLLKSDPVCYGRSEPAEPSVLNSPLRPQHWEHFGKAELCKILTSYSYFQTATVRTTHRSLQIWHLPDLVKK